MCLLDEKVIAFIIAFVRGDNILDWYESEKKHQVRKVL